MASNITRGSLTNYVNANSNQTLGGKKTVLGGINTKSQIVAGATVLGNDILFGVGEYPRLVLSTYLLPLVIQVVEYRFISRLTAH